ncbi:MAG: Orotidine 5'-phosphate decarboxylase [uncultured Arthrobacter sp.]|uniref:Orotidine 5'-phosphate decarboxylase n=1 Tax=uncultured Arthrobacter sp. TaxID=114050 RepID=A0A6J4JIH6_9MICC|nr:orotidine-5'-phosphate decarboxylase [uncultured Arthrobacter sp.]CAA9279065.1 MAG: Orotidine 5'-phosphate decarboxylase [uncultured Arthrobacter sp.]
MPPSAPGHDTARPAGAPRQPFGVRLAAARRRRGGLCIGIDPHPALLAAWDLPDSPAGLERFSLTVLEVLGPEAAALKPQVALYERHGSQGLAVLETLLARAAEADVLTIADAKRGDIGSTMTAYAQAWLAEGAPLAADAVTLNPYLGFESLRPALDLAEATGRGVFVLALTSNPEGASVQHTGGAESVALRIVRAAAAENQAASAAGVPGSVGLVIGATVGTAVKSLGLDLGALNGPILAPGVGAQGAGARELEAGFGAARPLVLPTSSRAVLAAGPDPARLREAARSARREVDPLPAVD